jgi:ABC-type multidrug transport system fused ATPase/permease subunit
MSVADNISYGCHQPVSRERLEEAAFQANALGFITSLPNGFDTIVTEKWVALSTPCKSQLFNVLIQYVE